MKTMTVSQPLYKPAIPYPNAATRQQILHKWLDILLIAASGAGVTVMLAFLLTLG